MTDDIGDRRPLSLVICLLSPLLVLMLGVIASLAIVLKASPELKRENGRGLVPPGFEVSISEPGEYVLWLVPSALEKESDGENKAAAAEDESPESDLERLPDGARVMIFRSDSKQLVEVKTMLNGRRNFGPEQAVSLGTFTATRAMDVEIKGTGIGDGVTVAVAPMKVGQMLNVAFSVGVVMVVSTLASIVILFALLHRRRSAIEGRKGVHSHAPVGLGLREE